LPEGTQSLEQQAVAREFVFPGDSTSLPAARESVMNFIREHGLSESEELDIFVALQEALANAIFHGCRDDAGKTIRCWVEIDATGITIVVQDPGSGFDVRAATKTMEDGNINNKTEHGRGICLMRSLMDQVSYQRGGAEVRLRKLRAIPDNTRFSA